MKKKIIGTYHALKSYILKWPHYNLFLLIELTFWSVISIWVDEKYALKKYQVVNRYLQKNYKIKGEKKYTLQSHHNKHIWIFWWQGLNSMPKICKACYRSLEKYKGEAKIHVVSESNLRDYLSIPQAIMDKVNNKTLSITNFSDIIRVMLLSKYGGLWVDATLYFVKEIPSSWFSYPFFSIKNLPDGYKFVSRNRWSTFIMGTNGETTFFNDFEELLVEYAAKEKIFLEYMLMDHIMDILFSKSPYKELLDQLPVMNEGLHLLRVLLNEPFDDCSYKELCDKNICFKLTYKMDFVDMKRNTPTYYKMICDGKA